MLPKINVFGLTISTYYLMMFVGFLAMGFLMLRRRKLYRLTSWQACVFTVLVMISGLAGCKLLFVLENWQYTRENGITPGGFSFFGAVFLVPLLMALFGRLFKLRPGESINASAPCVCAMVGTIRVGCFLNGCCGGWATASGFVWPTQAMESIGDFIILLWLLSREKQGDRTLYPEFMFTYGILRFLIEFLRDTNKDWLMLSHGQWFSMIGILIGLILLIQKNP